MVKFFFFDPLLRPHPNALGKLADSDKKGQVFLSFFFFFGRHSCWRGVWHQPAALWIPQNPKPTTIHVFFFFLTAIQRSGTVSPKSPNRPVEPGTRSGTVSPKSPNRPWSPYRSLAVNCSGTSQSTPQSLRHLSAACLSLQIVPEEDQSAALRGQDVRSSSHRPPRDTLKC